MTVAKASQVRYTEVAYQPMAACRGVLDYDKIDPDTKEPTVVTPCSWSYGPDHFPFVGTETKKRAKGHAQMNPGHEILVERVVRSVYWVDAPALAVEGESK